MGDKKFIRRVDNITLRYLLSHSRFHLQILFYLILFAGLRVFLDYAWEGNMTGVKPARLAYDTYDPETGTDEKLAPIIYLHGVSAAKDCWFDIPQTVANATKRKSYSLDARNHGDSEWSDEFNFDVNVDDLIHFMDSHGIEKAVLVGHSMGGVTALRTALKRPERVESIVVEDMFVKNLPRSVLDIIIVGLTKLKEAIAKIPPGRNEEESRKFVFEYFLQNVPSDLREYVKKSGRSPQDELKFNFLKRSADGRYVMNCNIKAIERAFLDAGTLASEPEGTFDGPALFVYGTQSPMKVGDEEQHIRQFFPNAVFEGLDTDHSVHLYKKVEFQTLLLKFLS